MEQEQQKEIFARIAAAHQELVDAYAELAGADEEEEEEEEEKPKRTRSNGKATNGKATNGKAASTTRTRSRKAKEEEDDDDDGDGDGDGEEEEITLETLQDLGDQLIKAKRKSALLTILKSFKAANISGIKKRDYPEVHAAMQDILE